MTCAGDHLKDTVAIGIMNGQKYYIKLVQFLTSYRKSLGSFLGGHFLGCHFLTSCIFLPPRQRC
jgi:hypothetical protein